MADSDSSDPNPNPSAADRDLQPFFVLHRASPPEDPEPEPKPRRVRRKIDVSQSPTKSRGDSVATSPEEHDDRYYEELRHQAFDWTWSKIEGEIKNVLRRIDLDLFNEVRQWILEQFMEIESVRVNCMHEIAKMGPLMDDEICRRIPAGLILTRNVEIVDDLLTFHELGVYLKSKRCHVANLSSSDFEAKYGIGYCLRSIHRQLVGDSPDAPDISAIASWYCKAENVGRPVVIIINDTELCNGPILAELIMLLSEWVIKVPVILVFGITTSIDAPKKLLSSNSLLHIHPYKFTSKSSPERMNSIIEEVLVRRCFGFCIGYGVSSFLRNYLWRHDGTLTSFIRALKIACVKHYYTEPLSFLGSAMFNHDSKGLVEKFCLQTPHKLLDSAFNLPSCDRESFCKTSGNVLLNGLHELQKLQKCWSSVLMCLFEVGKVMKMPLLDLFCEAVNPDLFTLRNSSSKLHLPTITSCISHGKKDGFSEKGGFIFQAIQKVRDLPVDVLSHLLKLWERHCDEIIEIHDKMKTLQSILLPRSEDMVLKRKNKNVQRSISSPPCSLDMNSTELPNMAALLMEGIVRDYLKPMECLPFHEIICFNHVRVLQEALVGDPRRTVQLDLRHSRARIHCSCCPKDGKSVVSSMQDVSIIYALGQEYGDIINLHDWYQSFKTIISSSNNKGKRRHQSPSSKKAKDAASHSDTTEAMAQARFCLAVKELQLTGLLRMPSKRRPDYVQRVAFGI